MAVNDRVEWTEKDIRAGQLAPSQANRTDWYPGRTDIVDNTIVGKDYRVPTSNPQFESDGNGPANMQRVRTVKLGRNIISDQALVSVPADPAETTQEADGSKERRSGSDWANGTS